MTGSNLDSMAHPFLQVRLNDDVTSRECVVKETGDVMACLAPSLGTATKTTSVQTVVSFRLDGVSFQF